MPYQPFGCFILVSRTLLMESKREGSLCELFSPDLMLASWQRSWSKMRTHIPSGAWGGFDGRTGTKKKNRYLTYLFPFLVTRTGIEPMLQPWKGRVLTAWPTGHEWWRKWDLNLWPAGYEPDALASELFRHNLLTLNAWLLYHKLFFLSIPFFKIFQLFFYACFYRILPLLLLNLLKKII